MLIAINDNEIINTDKFSHFDFKLGEVHCFAVGSGEGPYIASKYFGDEAKRLWSKLCKAAGKPEPFPRPVVEPIRRDQADDMADAAMRAAAEYFHILDGGD